MKSNNNNSRSYTQKVPNSGAQKQSFNKLQNSSYNKTSVPLKQTQLISNTAHKQTTTSSGYKLPNVSTSSKPRSLSNDIQSKQSYNANRPNLHNASAKQLTNNAEFKRPITTFRQDLQNPSTPHKSKLSNNNILYGQPNNELHTTPTKQLTNNTGNKKSINTLRNDLHNISSPSQQVLSTNNTPRQELGILPTKQFTNNTENKQSASTLRHNLQNASSSSKQYPSTNTTKVKEGNGTFWKPEPRESPKMWYDERKETSSALYWQNPRNYSKEKQLTNMKYNDQYYNVSRDSFRSTANSSHHQPREWTKSEYRSSGRSNDDCMRLFCIIL